jgi:hypothetical protein
MDPARPHRSRLVASGPQLVVLEAAAEDDAAHGAAGRTAPSVPSDLELRVGGDPERLGQLLAAVEPLRANTDAVIVTDADAEVERFLAVLAVLEGRAEMPAYDLADPSLKWHAAKGVKAVPNAPSIVGRPT